jgi:HEAT repeat protein
MDAVLPLLVIAAFAVPAVLEGLSAMGLIDWGARARVRLWREAARAASLSGVEESRGTLAGWSGPLRVRLSTYGSGRVHGTRITVSGSGLPAGLTVRPEGAGTVLQSVRGVREIEIGHDTFDSAAWVQGDPAVARAVLDSANRSALRALFEGRLERPRLSPFWATGRLDEGVLRVDVPEVTPPTGGERSEAGAVWAVGRDYVGGLDRLHEVLPAVLALARRLATPPDVARRLADNARSDPVTGVRLQCLTTLSREFPNHEATREALLAALEDPDAELRLRAGIALGREGRGVVFAIAGGEGAPDETTARAVAALAGSLSAEEATELLRSALRTRRLATAKECVGVLGRRGGRTAVEALRRVLAVEADELAWAAARALAMTRDPGAEGPLLRALGGGPRDLRLAAAAALGHVGTVAAVAPLMEAEAEGGDMRRAARQAVAQIQSRLAEAAGAAPGQLSLAGGESGRLSLATGEEGRLSLVSKIGSPGHDATTDSSSRRRTENSSGDGGTAPSE